jgi:formylglycine-generating enzyme required for sulfatase activity
MHRLTIIPLSVFLYFQVLSVTAQHFIVNSFKADYLSLSAKRYGRIDKNDKQCAVLKIITTIQGIQFECQPGITGNPEQRNGETWLYISPFTKNIRFTKEAYISTDYNFSISIEAGTVYILELGAKSGMPEVKVTPKPEESKPMVAPEIIPTPPTAIATYKKGAIFIRSNPTAASIYIDSVLQDSKTPVLLENFSPGTYQIRIGKPGFSDVVKKVQITSGKTAEMYEILPAPLGIMINSIPAGAIIFVNEKIIGKSPATIPLLAGTHTLKLSHSGYYNLIQSITVNEATKIDTLRLEPEMKFEMILIEGGTFDMGSMDAGEEEKPVHTVTLNSFYIGKYEITQQQWVDVMNLNPSKFNTCPQCPVESVSWNDVCKFIQVLNASSGKKFRLPTEAEWEFAARGGNKTKGFIFSGSNNADEVAWFSSNSDNKIHPVGEKSPNELGIYDMSGNVSEWCSDLYDPTYYVRSPANNPQGSKYGREHILRGGCWIGSPDNGHVSGRQWHLPVLTSDLNGFRLAQSQ